MSSLYYMSLSGIGDWQRALRESSGQLGPYYSYLSTAQTAAENRALSLCWREPEPEELAELEQRQRARWQSRAGGSKKRRSGRRRSPARKRPTGVWVILEPRPDRLEEPDSTFDAFYDGQSLFDRGPKVQGKKFIWPRKQESIDICDDDREIRALLIASAPEPQVDPDDPESEPIRQLYLRPNTWPLECQRRAVQTLEQRPTPRLSPLMRLLSSAARWPVFDPLVLEEQQWAILRSDDQGQLRDGSDEQRRFVARALATPDFAVLEGPPGSGKTTAICELIVQLLRAEKRVLLVASTHVAVDNVLERLLAWQDAGDEKLVLPVRIGDENNVGNDDLRRWVLKNLLRTWTEEVQEFLDDPRGSTGAGQGARTMLSQALDGSGQALAEMLLEAANLVCGTTIGILQHPAIKSSEHGLAPFDVMILDEASKTTFTEFLVPALHARRWVIVGDRRQLSPYVEELDLAENLAGVLPSEQAQAAVHTFLVSSSVSQGMRVSALVAVQSDREAHLFADEAEAREVELVDLDGVEPESLRGVDGTCPQLLTTQLVLGDPDTLVAWEHRLPGDLRAVVGPVPDLADWQAHRRALETRDLDEPVSWAHEVAWRQIRAHELRSAPAEQQRLLDEIAALLPKTLDNDYFEFRRRKPRMVAGQRQSPTEALDEDLANIRRAAMPSILEILQVGAGARDWSRETALTTGLGQDLGPRMVSLRFQHRMHPDISRFPREQFYSHDNLLNDAAGMLSRRQWSYGPDGSRARWIAIARRRGERGNANLAEAEVLMDELRNFLDWAKIHSAPEGGTWEIAALTFYRAQERLLCNLLRQESGQHANSRNFYFHRHGDQPRAHVTLCTVDRFQGHEADLVLLSFVKSGSVGFLNSPNRLNVALTRARYQITLIGDQTWLGSDRCRSDLLRSLANSPHYARELTWDRT